MFGRINREFLSKGFWNATTLKMKLSVTPLLLLLTSHTKIVTLNELTNFERVTKCSLKTIVNTLDGTELVCVLSEESLCDRETSQAYVQEYTYRIYLYNLSVFGIYLYNLSLLGSQTGVVDTSHAFHFYFKCCMLAEFQSIST